MVFHPLKIEMFVGKVRKCEVDVYYDNLNKRIWFSFNKLFLCRGMEIT